VHLTDAIGPTALRVTGGKLPYELDLCSGAVFCQTTTRSDGSTVTEAEYAEGAQEITRSVSVRKFKSGYVAQIQSFNYNPASGSGLRQTVPVRVGVLTELVTDSSIDWE
jgi:hypothetical protein